MTVPTRANRPANDPGTSRKARADAGNRTPNLLITNRQTADSGDENPHHDTASSGQYGLNRPAKRTRYNAYMRELMRRAIQSLEGERAS